MMSQNVFYSEVCAILAKETSDPFINIVVRSTDRGNCTTNYNSEHTDTKYEGWIILPCYSLYHNFSTVDREVSSTARALLSLRGLRPGFQEMVR